MSFVIKSSSYRRQQQQQQGRRKSDRESVPVTLTCIKNNNTSFNDHDDDDQLDECITTYTHTMCNLSTRLLLVLFISLVLSTQHAHGASGPTFLDKFTDQTLEPGPSVSLRCIASGQPLPQVTWLVNGQPVPDHSRFRTGDYVTRDLVVVSYVNISSVTAQDGGIYQCTASNGLSSIKHSARLKVFGPPYIRPMENMTAVAGESFTVICPVSGHPIDQIYWQKDNQRLPLNHRHKIYPNGTLTVTDVERAADEGKYTCTALGATSTSLSTSPSSTSQSSSTLSASKMHQLTVSEMNHPSPTSSSTVTSSATKSASSSFTLNVQVRPVIEPFVFPKSLHQGQRYTILCSVSKGDLPVTIKWYKDGRQISSSSGLHPEFGGIGVSAVTSFASNLVFDAIRPEHTGNYTCEASNGAGSVSHNGSMIIHVPPRWMIEPQDTSVLKGKTGLIDCQADGFPPPSVRWSKTDGLEKNPPSDFKPVISNPHMRVFQNGSLAVNAVTRSDSASYLCQITNGIGSGLSKVVKLTVHVAAHFKSKFRAETVRKGHEASIKCEAEGDRPITISWMKDKSPLSSKDEPRYELIESATKEGVTSTLLIRAADRRDSALFTCVTFNSYGGDDTNIQLIMQEPPDPPQDVKVVEVDGRSATISWSPPFSGNSPIINYLVQHKLESEKWASNPMAAFVNTGHQEKEIASGVNNSPQQQQQQQAPSNSGAAGSSGNSNGISLSPSSSVSSNLRSFVTNSTVSGADSFAQIRPLKPVHSYQVRVFAINALGRSEASEIISFKSDEEAPGGPPLHIKAISLSSKSIRITWKSPREDLQFGHIKGYYVGYKVFASESDSFVYKTLEVTDTTTDSLEECTLTGLKRFTKYAITVQAFNSKGTGPASEVIEIQTLQNDPPPAPILKVSSVTTSSIHLSWSLAKSMSTSHSNDDTFMSSNSLMDGSPSDTSESLALHNINSNSNNNNNNVNNQVSLINNIASMSSSSSSSVSNGAFNQPGIVGFILHQKKSDSSNDWEELRLSGDRTSHSLERLACGSKYQYYVVAFNAVGKSDPSEILSTKTEGTAPVAPDKHSLVMTNTTAATIFLDSWHDGSCPISSFEISYKPRKSSRAKWETMRIFAGESKTVTLKDLLPSTVYDLKIIASNEAGHTDATYTITTASLIRAPAIVLGNEASVSFTPPLYLDVSLILPTTISIVMVVLLIFVVRIWLLRKRQSSGNSYYGTVYGSQSAYESTKSQNGESVCLSELTPANCSGGKKLNATLNGSGGLILDTNGASITSAGGGAGAPSSSSQCDGNLCYPSPYDMTKLTDCNVTTNLDNTSALLESLQRGHTIPLKSSSMVDSSATSITSSEPMYATVKRTPRAPRSSDTTCHVYQYPLTLQGATLIAPDGSCYETESSCVSISSGVGPQTTSAYIRINEDSITDKSLAVPLLISEDGRQIQVGTLRRGCHQNFAR